MRRRYTPEEDATIIKYVAENTNNLREGFRKASPLIGRNAKAIEMRWYKTLSKNPTASTTVFNTIGRKKHTPNRKVVINSAVNAHKIKSVRASKFKRIIAILFDLRVEE